MITKSEVLEYIQQCAAAPTGAEIATGLNQDKQRIAVILSALKSDGLIRVEEEGVRPARYVAVASSNNDDEEDADTGTTSSEEDEIVTDDPVDFALWASGEITITDGASTIHLSRDHATRLATMIKAVHP